MCYRVGTVKKIRLKSLYFLNSNKMIFVSSTFLISSQSTKFQSILFHCGFAMNQNIKEIKFVGIFSVCS